MAATSRPLVEGPLSKWTNVVSGWQYRWFVLDQSSGMLSYYTVSGSLVLAYFATSVSS